MMIRLLQQGDTDKLRDMLYVCGVKTRQLFCPMGTFWSGGGPAYIYSLALLTRSKVYVIEENNLVYGFGYYYQQDNEEFIAYFGILIADTYQRKGYGSLMLTALEDDARANGFSALRTSGGTYWGGFLLPILKQRGYQGIQNFGDRVVMEMKL